MIKQHIKIAWRSLKKAKTLSAIHIIGLAVAIAASTLLYLTAMFELSYNNFHQDIDKIALLYKTSQEDADSKYNATMPVPLAPMVKAEIPGIELASRYLNEDILLRHGEKQFHGSNKYVDPDFLSIFTFSYLGGNTQALNNIDNIVIDDQVAENLFGTTQVIGKQVEVNAGGVWTNKNISAVIKRKSANSSLHFNSLIRFEQYPGYKSSIDNWSNQNHSVFVKFANTPPTDDAFTLKAKAFMELYFKDNQEMLKRDGAKADKNGIYLSLHQLPFKSYHRNDLGLGDASSPIFPWILLLIAGLILLIACSNFVNLSLANSFARNREIGTRKTLGSSTNQLIGQLWTESLMLCVIALIIGLGIAWLVLSEYNAMMNYRLTIGELFTPLNLTIFIFIFLFITILAGGYPAWRIAQSNIIQTLKGTATVKTSRLRNSLTVVQFTIATVLIIATIIISFQLRYVNLRPLGFDKNTVISIPIGVGIEPELALQKMRNALASQPSVEAVSAADINLGRGRDGNMSDSRFGFDYEGRQVSTNFMRIDYDYLKTLDIKLVSGRDFDRSYLTDSSAVLINKQMAIQLGGVDKVLNKTLKLAGSNEIIGIIDDFNFKKLDQKVQPLTLSINPGIFTVQYIFVRVNGDQLSEQLAKVEKVWKTVNPKATIEASFLDDNIQDLYREEQRFVKIIISGAIIAISISSLGLFALALMMINKRVKEIGIRKVLGSSVSSIMLLLSKDFLKLMLIAFLIATPIAWWMMQNWLQHFVYRIDIQWWMFLLAGLISVVIAMVTIAWQTLRAATGNPINSLRDE